MATSLAQLNKQIVKLERQAQSIKKKDSVAVIARIKEAIAIYDLTAEDLGFGRGTQTSGRPQTKTGGARAKTRGQYKTGIKFRDDEGNVWSGHGRRPNWYVNAIASGKTPEQLAA